MRRILAYHTISIFFFGSLFFFYGCKEKEEKIILGSSEISLNKNWQFRQAGKEEWMESQVPGCVHTDLLTNNIISDPFNKDNERKLQWIEREDWEYKTNFYIPFSTIDFDNIELQFDGLDTYASVYLNDSLLLKADNMFIGWQIPCKKFLKAGENSLRIYFHSPINKVLPHVDKLNYRLPAPYEQSKLKSNIFTRKAAYQYGWDYSPRLVTSGIWRPVHLHAWNTARITSVKVIQQQIVNARADLTAAIEIESEINIKAELIIKSKENLFRSFKKNINLIKGKNIYHIDFNILKPIRWWPNGAGESFLYNVLSELKINNSIADSVTVRTGLRTIEVKTEKDSNGESFNIVINDKKIYIKGASYVPADLFPSRVSDKKYKQIILSAKEAHINMLKIAGSGIYESEDFYNYCDENGILIWQDFMFSSAMYPPDEGFRKNVEDEIAFNVKKLRNHPCIALWCGNDNIENDWYNSKYQNIYHYSFADSASILENYLQLFHIAIPNIVKEYDDRFYLHSSPKYPDPKNKNSGDRIFTDSWKDVKNAGSFFSTSGRFISEFGFQSLPNVKTIQSFTGLQDYNLESTVIKSHQKLADGNKILRDYILNFYKVPKNFESLIYVSQLMQGKLLKTAIESQRRKKPYCMGSIYNNLNDSWPGLTSATIDYYNNTKASYFFVKRAFNPILVSPVEEDGKLKIYIVSDRLISINGILQIKIIDFNGKQLFEQQIPVQVLPNSNKVYFESSEWKKYMKGKAMKSLILEARLSENEKIYHSNIHYFGLPKDLNLPSKNKINFTLTGKDGNFTATLSSVQFQKNVFLQTSIESLKFSDNYFDLLPNEKIIINVSGDKSLKAEDLLKKITIKTLADSYK